MSYDGGTLWGVRHNEDGHPPHIRRCDSETQARGLHRALTTGYQRQGRTDRPELVSARITWEPVPSPTTPTDERPHPVNTNIFHSDATGTVEAHQYDGTQESADTIAAAFGLTTVQHSPRAAVYTVPTTLEFSPGDYYDADNREIAIPANAWIWVNHDRHVLGAEWDEYFRDHFTTGPRDAH